MSGGFKFEFLSVNGSGGSLDIVKYLLSTYYVPVSLVSSEETLVGEIWPGPALSEFMV